MKLKRKDILIAFIHLAVMVLVIILPAVGSFITTSNGQEASHMLHEAVEYFIPIFTFYFINYYWLIPKYYYKSRTLFFIINFILSLLFTFGIEVIDDGFFWNDHHFDAPWFFFIFAIDVVTYLLAASCALAIRSIIRLNEVEIQLQEVKQRNAETELQWLKNQLNPHFLFNTLNNISSLVYINADQAQDSITKLSELLRYALYESSKAEVALSDEIEFMENFISLMELRCSDKVKVETHFDLSHPDVKIAPMLFISVLENAFKHGVSAHQPSFIQASLEVGNNELVFTCDNSNFPKKEQSLTGGGVGIENTKRRLELLYPERNEYIHTLKDEVYHVVIRIKLS